ncbi:MAG: hypothetical protein ACQSGP_05025, partial [Frankia sp.]
MRRWPRLRSISDRLAVSDPGWGRALMGWQMLVSLTAAIAVGYGVARGLGQPVVLGMTVGGVMALITGLLVPNTPVRALARSIGWIVAAYPIGLLLSVELSPHRTAALTLVAIVIFLQFYLARFGLVGLYVGTMLFASYLSGVLAPVPLHVYPRLLLIAVAAAVACLLARIALCWHRPAWELRQTGHAFEAACRRAAASAVTVLDRTGQPDPAARQLRHALDRVNTVALAFDGRLGHTSVDPSLAEHLHRRVFDVEHALVSLAELCHA